MRVATLVLTSMAALVAGVLFGRSHHGATFAAPSSSVAKADDDHARGERQSDRTLAFADNDERIVRLFSALKEPLVLKKRSELFDALGNLTAQDLPALVKHVEDFPVIPRNELLPILVERWFELDFDAARNWMRGHPREFAEVAAWAKANPEAAIQEALAGPESWRSAMLVREAIKQLAGEDPSGQATRLKTLPSGKLRDDIFGIVLGEWASNDPAAAFAALGEISPGRTRDKARDGVLRAWADRDPAGALSQVNAILPTLKAGVLGNELTISIADAIGKKDPRLVLDWLTELPVEFRTAPAIAAARIWAAKEPVAALDWCLANGVDIARGKRDGFMGWQAGVLGEAMAAQPDATVAWLQALPAGPNRDRLLERGLADALWRVPKDQLFGDGNAIAMRIFNDLAEESKIRISNTLGVQRAKVGGLNDLNAWAQNFAPGPARANAIIGAITAAYERDASSVEPLLASTASAPDRDAALRGLAEAMSNSAPADAAARALAINETPLRRETLETIVTSWQKRDTDAARAWLQSADALPAAWKQAWLRTP